MTTGSNGTVDDDVVSAVRIQQSDHAIAALETSLTEWLDRHVKKDVRKQYKSLFDTLRTQLSALITEVRTSFRSISPSASRGDVYAMCRLTDKRLLWIERLWRYFQDKFDQRDGVYRDLLAAADEVVWSCYAQPFRLTKTATGTVPLPWVTPEYSPRAIGRTDVPREFRAGADGEFFAEMLRELPIPLVSLPPQCVDEPWWLIYLAHEVGHHVQADLLPGQQLVSDFRDLVRTSIPADGERWQYRGEEIFADAYSVHMTGPWALWALTELEWTSPAAMLDDDDVRYPAPLTRLTLLCRMLDLMKVSRPDQALRGFAIDTLRVDATGADEVVTALASAVVTTQVAKGKTLAQLSAWNLTEHQGRKADVPEWKETFLRNGGMAPNETLSAARLALAGGVAAWAEISLERDYAKRAAARSSLASKLLAALRASHEPVERAAEQKSPAASAVSRPLRSLLFDSDPARLGAW